MFRKELFSAGGFKKGDNKKEDEWIQCDGCLKWYHISCVNVEEFLSKLIDKYYCEACNRISISESHSYLLVKFFQKLCSDFSENNNSSSSL